MPLDEMPLPKKRMRDTGEKIYPNPETPEDLVEQGQFDSFPIKDRSGSKVYMFDDEFTHDPVYEENRIMKEPFFTRQAIEKRGNGNLIVNSNLSLSYYNGKEFNVPINFYKGITREKGDQFEEIAPFKSTNYTEGTGMFFTTNLDDAHLESNNTIPKLEEVWFTELQEIKNSRKKKDDKRVSVVQVHIAPKRPLNIVSYESDKPSKTFIQNSKDYEKILAATEKLIAKNDSEVDKDQKGLTIQDFDRKKLEVYTHAEDFMIRTANMTKDGQMFLSGDPNNPLPGEKFKYPEEKWRWKFQHPDRRGQLSLEDLISFLPSSDFADIAKAAGYTASVIQYHPSSSFMMQMPYDSDNFYEVVLYQT